MATDLPGFQNLAGLRSCDIAGHGHVGFHDEAVLPNLRTASRYLRTLYASTNQNSERSEVV